MFVVIISAIDEKTPYVSDCKGFEEYDDAIEFAFIKAQKHRNITKESIRNRLSFADEIVFSKENITITIRNV